MRSKLFLPIIIFTVLLFGVVGVANAITLDNDGGGAWAEYMSFPLETTPSEYAQYRIVIDNTTWTIYNATGGVEITVSYDGFWSKVQDDGDDIRVFNQSDQLYFWIEEWDYANQTAVIWVNLTAGSSELNIAYGNPSATKSSYENGEQVFEFFDDFEGSLNTSKWSGDTNYVEVVNGLLHGLSASNWHEIKHTQAGNILGKIVEAKAKITSESSYTKPVQIGDGTHSFAFRQEYNNNDLLEVIDGSTTTKKPDENAINEDVYDVYKIIVYEDGSCRFVNSLTEKLSTDFTDVKLQNTGTIEIKLYTGTSYWDWIRVLKLADPTDFKTPLYIVSKSPATNLTLYYGFERQFSVHLSTYANVSWYLDGSKIKTDTNVLNSSLTVTFTDVGTHKVDVMATNGAHTVTTCWNIEVVQYELVSPIVDPTHLILWLIFDEGKEPIKDYSGHSYTISANGNFVTGRYGYGFNGSLSISISKPTNYTIVYWLKEDDGWHFYAFTNTAKYKDLKSGDYTEHFTWSTELSFDNVIIDDIKAYNATLSFEQIKQMYEALRVKFYDESSGEKIKANATIFNANYSINLQVDSITKEAVLFHSQVPEYGKYQVKVEAGGYSPRYYGVNLTDDKRIELDTYLPPSDKSVLIIFQLEDNANFYNNNTMLILKKAIGNESKTIYQNYFDIEKKCSVYLIKDDIYHVYVDNGIETKYLGIYSSAVSTNAILKIGEEISQIIQKGVTLPLHTVTLIVIKALKPYAHVPIAVRDTVHGNSYVVYTDDEGKAVIWVNSTIPYEIDVNNSEKVIKAFLPLEEKYIVVVPYNGTLLNQTYNVLYNVTNCSVLQIGKNISSQLSPSARGILTAIILWAVMQSTVRVVGNVSVVGLAVLVILTIIGLADPMSCVFAGMFVVGMYVLKRWL